MNSVQRVLRVTYDDIPPSDNAIREVGYRFVGGKRKAVITYTKEATNFKEALVRYIGSAYFAEVQAFVRGHRPTMVYQLSLVLSFPASQILNKGWLEVSRTGEKGAQSPYKRVDTMNRRKLVEDCLSEALGIDDSLFWEGSAVKLVNTEDASRLDMILEEMDPLHYGVPEVYLE